LRFLDSLRSLGMTPRFLDFAPAALRSE